MDDSFLANLSKTLISLITPDSLAYAGEDVKYSLTEFQESEKIKNNLIPGDIILIRTPGIIYSIFRKAVDVRYDHMAVFLGDNTVLHISPPKIRKLNANLFLMRRREPLILRPKLNSQTRESFLQELKQLLGAPYDYKSLFNLFGKKLITNYTQDGGYNPFLKDITFVYISNVLSNKEIKYLPKKNICTDVVFLTLAQVSPEFRKLLNSYLPSLDISYLGAFSPDDVLALNRKTDFFTLIETYGLDEVAAPPITNTTQKNSGPEKPVGFSEKILKDTKQLYSNLDQLAHKASENSKIYKGIIDFLEKLFTKLILEKVVHFDFFSRTINFDYKQLFRELNTIKNQNLQNLKALYVVWRLWRLTRDKKKVYENKRDILKYFLELLFLLHQNNVIRDSKKWLGQNLRSRL